MKIIEGNKYKCLCTVVGYGGTVNKDGVLEVLDAQFDSTFQSFILLGTTTETSGDTWTIPLDIFQSCFEPVELGGSN